MSRKAPRRVAITGLGIVSSLGTDVPSFWRRCLDGDSVVRPIPSRWTDYATLRSRWWAPLGEWSRETPRLTRVERKQMDPTSQMAVLAAEEALAQAGLEATLFDRKRNRYRLPFYASEDCGTAIGTGVGGIHSSFKNLSITMLSEVKKRLEQIRDRLAIDQPDEAIDQALVEVLERLRMPRVFNAFSVAMAMPNAVSANLAIKFGLTGPSRTFTCACASGTVAIGRAFEMVRQGACEMVLSGGTEYLSDEYGGCFRGFDAIGALVRGDLPAERINRPFDEDRSGFLFGEGGAAVLVLEELSRARERGATVLAEIRGYGETCDAYNTMVMDPEGRQVARAVELCLNDAGLEAADIDYINAHGTGTPTNDPLECRVLSELFGARPRVNSTKSLIGHTLGASGAIEAVVTVQSLLDGRIHPCRNLTKPIADLGFAIDAEGLPLRHALSQSFAFGGQNAVLAFAAG